MPKILIYISFIPWFLYFLATTINAYKDLKTNKFNKKWLKKNFLKVFHFDNLILLGIFIFFSVYYGKSGQVWLAEVLLFGFINLYLFFNYFYYDKNKSKAKLVPTDLSPILILIIIALIPIIRYGGTKNYIIAYYLLFGLSFFNYLTVIIANFIHKLVVKLICYGKNK